MHQPLLPPVLLSLPPSVYLKPDKTLTRNQSRLPSTRSPLKPPHHPQQNQNLDRLNPARFSYNFCGRNESRRWPVIEGIKRPLSCRSGGTGTRRRMPAVTIVHCLSIFAKWTTATTDSDNDEDNDGDTGG